MPNLFDKSSLFNTLCSKPNWERVSEKFNKIYADIKETHLYKKNSGIQVVNKFSNQIDGLMQYLKYTSCHLIGFSLGGLIAAHYASTRSKKIDKLILFGTIYGRSAEQQQEAIKRYENVSKEYFHTKMSIIT